MHPLPEPFVKVRHLRRVLQRLVESDAVVAAPTDAVALRPLGLVEAGIAAADAPLRVVDGDERRHGLLLAGPRGRATRTGRCGRSPPAGRGPLTTPATGTWAAPRDT